MRKLVLLTILLSSSLGWSKIKNCEMDHDAKNTWNFRYSQDGFMYGTQPLPFLMDVVPLLPKNGKVLDLAMGEGRNGVFLAKLGYDVLGVDISDVGLKKAEELARKNKTHIKTQVADLANYNIEDDSYDIIVMSYYMQRELFPKMKRALKKGGVILIENYTEANTKYDPSLKPDWLLKKDELFNRFSDMKVLRYQDVDDGRNAYSSLLAKKL